jgi:hypothetical protein
MVLGIQDWSPFRGAIKNQSAKAAKTEEFRLKAEIDDLARFASEIERQRDEAIRIASDIANWSAMFSLGPRTPAIENIQARLEQLELEAGMFCCAHCLAGCEDC